MCLEKKIIKLQNTAQKNNIKEMIYAVKKQTCKIMQFAQKKTP